MIEGLPTSSGRDFLRALSARYLAVPLRVEQESLIMNAFGIDPEGAVSIEAIPLEQVNAGLHLLFSAAEYQLC